MLAVRCIVAVLAVAWVVETRPYQQDIEILAIYEPQEAHPILPSAALTDIASSGSLAVIEVVGEASEAVSGLVSDGASSVQTIKHGVKNLARDVWTAGSQAFKRFNDAARDTAEETLRGTQDSIRATNIFLADGARAAGRLAAGAVRSALDTTRDTADVSAVYVKDVSDRVLDGMRETGEAIGGFVGEVVDNTRDFVKAQTDVVERTVVRGVENLAHIPQPPVA